MAKNIYGPLISSKTISVKFSLFLIAKAEKYSSNFNLKKQNFPSIVLTEIGLKLESQ